LGLAAVEVTSSPTIRKSEEEWSPKGLEEGEKKLFTRKNLLRDRKSREDF